MGDLSRNWDGLPDDESECRYILDSNKVCGAPREARSPSYCAEHHSLCYLTADQAKERGLELEALAKVVGGRLPARMIFSHRELQRIERRAKANHG
jgi:hypothetical protein